MWQRIDLETGGLDFVGFFGSMPNLAKVWRTYSGLSKANEVLASRIVCSVFKAGSEINDTCQEKGSGKISLDPSSSPMV